MTSDLENYTPPLRICVSAGELSGDQHCAEVVRELLSAQPETTVRGMGGRNLSDAGCEIVVDSEQYASVNGFNIIQILRGSLYAFYQMAKLLIGWRPHLLILVDYPDFNLRLARVAKLFNIPVLYFIPPKMWAWRKGRVRKMRKLVDETALIFPFEKEFYHENRYRSVAFVGHPFVDTFGADTAAKDVNADKPTIVVLPGSRESEVKRHMPKMIQALEVVRGTNPNISVEFVKAPSLDKELLESYLGDHNWMSVTEDDAVKVMKRSDTGLLKCGTCNLEAAFIGLPFAAYYTVPKFTELLVRLFVKVKEYSLVNIIRPGTIKELIQKDATSENVAKELQSLLNDKKHRESVSKGLAEVVNQLKSFDSDTRYEACDSTYERVSAIAIDHAEKRASRQAVLKRIFGYLGPYKRHFIAALVCMVIFGASDGVIPFLVKYILDGVFANKDTALLAALPVMLIGFTVLRASADFGQQFLMSRVGHNIIRDIRAAIHGHLLRLSPGYFVRNSSGNILSRFTSDVVLVRQLLTGSFASLIRDVIRITALVVAAFYLDPLLALIAFFVFPLGLIPVIRFGKRMRKLSKRGQDAIGNLSGIVQEAVLGNKEVKIFGREDYEEGRFETENEKLNNTFIKSEFVSALTGPVNEVLAIGGIAAVILYGGHSVIGGVRSQGDFIAFLFAVFLLYDPFKKLSKLNNVVQQGLSGAERIFELLDVKPDIVEPANPKTLTGQLDIELIDVSFSYDDGDSPALQEISLHIPEGKKFALVGFSGAGKSTLVDLIPRLIDPGQGQVKIGGTDLRETALADLRSKVAMVGQHTFLFHDTIFNNIAYGNPSATREDVIEAAKAAYAYDFIMALPEGFDTVIGESGFSLSGGERQRIAIARAVLKDAPILVFDEATASLDNKAEREVQAAVHELEKDRTTIVIAHRLSTVRDADCIVVMESGKIAEVGTHEELLKKDGSFAKLYRLQFADEAETNGHLPPAAVS